MVSDTREAQLHCFRGSRVKRTWECRHDPSDLDRCIQLFHEAGPLISASSQDEILWFNEFGLAIMSRFEQTGSVEDLDHVIDLGERALVACPGHRRAFLSNLAYALQNRFEVRGYLPDLDKAIGHLEEAVTALDKDEPNRASLLTNLGRALALRFEDTGAGSIEDLNRAISFQEEAVASSPHDPNQAAFLNNLGNVLQTRYDQLGELEDLDHAIDVIQRAVDLAAEEDLKLPDWLNNLGIALQSRFERTGSLRDLARAVDAMENAVKLTPQDHIDRPDSLHNLGTLLLRRFEQTGSLDDLDLAIKVHADADILMPADHNCKAICLSGLGNALVARFERIGATEDLNRAIEVETRALDLTPDPHPDRAKRLLELGVVLHFRFRRTHSLDDLKRAIKIKEEAVNSTPEYSPKRPKYLDSLGVSLQSLFEVTHAPADLDYAITTKDEALMLTPDDHTDRAMLLNNLANSLQSRFELCGSMADLDTAVVFKEQAVLLTPTEHSDRAARLHSLAISLELRFKTSGLARDLEQAINRNEESANDVVAPPTIRINAAKKAAELLINRDLRRANKLLRSAVVLLPFVSPLTLGQDDRQYEISQFAGLTAEAVSVSLESGDPLFEVVSLLELGRGVLAKLQIDMRSGISTLWKDQPELGKRFEYLRDVLDRPEVDSVQDRMNQEERRDLRKEMDNIVNHIRQNKEHFFHGLSEHEIGNIAQDGPVILFNISKLRSDTIIIEKSGIRSLNLPSLLETDLADGTRLLIKAIQDKQGDPIQSRRDLKKVLEWLWDVAINPIFDLIGFNSSPLDGEAWPQVWWIASGLLNLLPIHAAGYHDDGSGRTVVDRVISSYTPTIRSLQYARDRMKNWVSSKPIKALAVVMPDTPGHAKLENVKAELHMLQMQLHHMFLTVKTSPTRTEVLDELAKHQLVHFSCHGVSNTDPSKSMLLLIDWKARPLTVSDIASLNIEGGQFAYLSACDTARGLDIRLLDESINLAVAMQLAGYPSVVGTLWQVLDKTAAVVAERVYSWLFRAPGCLQIQNAAEALHHAIRVVREETRGMGGSERKVPSDPFFWAPYVHVGV